jgi:hypothetical protein
MREHTTSLDEEQLGTAPGPRRARTRDTRVMASVAAMLGAFASLAIAKPSVCYGYRPFDGTDADVAKAGEFELELGAAYAYDGTPGARLTAPATTLNLGLVSGFELVLDIKNVVPFDRPLSVPDNPLTSSAVQLKGLLRNGCLQGKRGPSIATEVGLLLPNLGGASGLGGSVDLIFSQRIEPLTLHLNVEGARTPAGPYLVFASVIAEGPPWPVRPVAELSVDYEPHSAPAYSDMIGAIWTATEALSVDAGFRATTTQARAPVGELRLGLTWSATVWKPRAAASQQLGSR